MAKKTFGLGGFARKSGTLWGVIFLAAGLLAASCKGDGNAVSAVKKGHFDAAPKITVEALVKRYQYTDPKSVTWELVTDDNNNESVKVSARFDREALIVFAGVRERVASGAADSSVLAGSNDRFFGELLREASSGNGKAEYKGPMGMAGPPVWQAMMFRFEPDYESGGVFFHCQGGVLEIIFTADAEGKFSIKQGSITFNMTSLDGDDELKYDLAINLSSKEEIQCLEAMLVNNADYARSAGLNL
ncbi:MAG: hypothetical protein LBD37_05170 [Treponema sp.]|jgi:hypothetical protein|nr:hypothetical protein [Treponema sp.]